MLLVYIGIGGALGAISRYLCSNWIVSLAGDLLPFGTLGVNIIGSFLLGFIYNLSINVATISGEARALLTIGFIGSFTTFSTYMTETVNLYKEGNWLNGSIYLFGSVLLGLLAVLAGMALSNFFLTLREGRKQCEPQDNGAS